MEKWSKEQLCSLAEEFGTPLYVYDTAIMKQQLETIHNAFTFPHKVYFSCKASGNPAILKYFNSLGCGLDTVSLNQVLIGIQVGFQPKNILYTPNGSSFDSVEKAYNLGVAVNFDNLEHLERFAQIYPKAEVFLRFNPGIIAGGSANVSVGHLESKFGIHQSQLSHVLKIITNYNVTVKGIHVHAGSDIIDENQFIESAKQLFSYGKYFPELEYINLGSGFRVAYKDNERSSNLKAIGEELLNLVNKTETKPTVIVEPGKFLTSEAGVFIVKVNLIKQSPSAIFVFVNSGFNHLIRPMYYNAYHKIENLQPTNKQTKIYNIVGYLGETDTFGWNRPLQKVEEGDLLVIKNAGAYGYSMASNYNSREKPAEVLLHNNEAILISRRENLKDVISLSKFENIDFL